jgi:transitional endoplasmic reticulum ATPase
MAIQEDVTAEQFLAQMLQGASFGGKKITGDEVAFHDGAKIILPNGMTYTAAYAILKRLEEEAEMETSFDRRFKYRSDDGAYATIQVIKERYGMLLGKKTETFFGTIPAETRTIAIGVNQTMQVPWGRLEIPIFPGLELVLCDRHEDRDYGKIFEIHATGPRKYRDEIESFFDAVGEFLETKSIYRGRAIIGSDNPEFLDLSTFDASKIVFSEEVTASLEGTLWAPIKYTQAMRDQDVSLKRAVLAYGPFGTGKTSTGQLTAEIATANDWTFISAKPGRDKVEDVLRTARLYQPAVVFVEDIDTAVSSGEDDEVTKFLDAFDGITAKGGELMILMTTNHIESIHRGMLRPGRLDAVIEIAALDRPGVERLIKAVIPENTRDAGIDYDVVAESMEGFLPAFIREAVNRAVMFSINRLEGASDYVIATDDLVHAANSLKPQLAAMEEASEGVRRPGLNVALGDLVKGAIKELEVYETGRDATLVIQDSTVEA